MSRAESFLRARCARLIYRLQQLAWALPLVDQAIVSGISFALSVIVARTCSKEQLGLYTLGMSVVLFATGIQSAFITTPYTVYSPRVRGPSAHEYAGSTLLHEVVLSAIAAVMLSGVAWLLSGRRAVYGGDWLLWSLAAAVAFILLREYARRVSFSWLQARNAIAMDACAAAVTLVLILVLWREGLLSAATVYGAVGCGCGVAALFWLYTNRHRFDPQLSRVTSDFRRNASFGKWVLVATLLYSARSEMYPWLLAKYEGVAATGMFAACLGIVLLSNPLLIGISNVLGPRAAHTAGTTGGIRPLRHLVYKATWLICLSMLPLTIAIVKLAARLLVLIYGPQYGGHGAVVAVLAFSIFVASLALGFDAGLYAMDQPRAIVNINLLGLAAALSIGLWLTQRDGLIGAAYGHLAGNMVVAALKCAWFVVSTRRSQELERITDVLPALTT